MSKHHRTMTYRDKMTLAAEMINEGKTYGDVAEAMQYKSEGSVSRIIRDAKAQGLIKTGSEWKQEVLVEKERADLATARVKELEELLANVDHVVTFVAKQVSRTGEMESLVRELVDTLNLAQESLHENGIGIVDDRQVMKRAKEALG